MKTIQIASDTLAVLEKGNYKSPLGQTRNISTSLKTAIGGTQLYLPEELELLEVSNAQFQTQITVTPETTLQAMQRLTQNGLRIAALNFASARNPGGGFLRGAQAQEESLARSSGLYACLQHAPDFYQHHRHNTDLRYSHRMIYSPDVPFFKNDAGDLLEVPYTTSIITSAAPNYGALEQQQPQHLPSVPNVLAARAELVLRLAAHHQHRHLVLGAWGCGVFKNPPELVARVFLELLNGGFANAFESVVFAVYDRSKQQNVIGAFRQVFA
jgi:uncharacterized protein (TIGR02452 family)